MLDKMNALTWESAMRHSGRFALMMSAAVALAGCVGEAGPEARSLEAARAQDAVGSSLRLAQAARAAGDFSSAVNLYRRILAGPTADPAVAVELGDTLLEAGSIDDAIDTYDHVALESKARIGALLGLERAYAALSQTEKALAYADQAKALAPSDARVLINRGIVLDMVSRHAEAQESYRAALAKDPHDRAARNNLALSLAMTGKFTEAVAIMTPIAWSSNATPKARQNLALIYGLMGDERRATELSRVDLDETATQANLRFFAFVRTAND